MIVTRNTDSLLGIFALCCLFATGAMTLTAMAAMPALVNKSSEGLSRWMPHQLPADLDLIGAGPS